MKKILLTALIIVAITIGLLVAIALSAKFLVEGAMAEVLGARVKIGRMYLDLKEHTFYVKDFKVYNPEGFNKHKALAYLPEISAEFSSKTLVEQRKIHLIRLKVIMLDINRMQAH